LVWSAEITVLLANFTTHHKILQYRVKWADFGIESSTWVGADMLTDHTKFKDYYWQQKWAIQDILKEKTTRQNKRNLNSTQNIGLGWRMVALSWILRIN
jgi:hypothetical protein